MTKPIRMAQIALPCALMLVTLTPGAFADQYDKMTNVTISQPIEVPGAVLQPGTYTFKLLDEPSDRHIVQISSLDGKHTYAIVFTAAARRINVTSTPTLTFYEAPSGQPQAVNKWFWPGEQDGQQFLYSHEEAQKIDQASGVKVPEAPPEASQSAVAQNTEPQNAPQAQQSQA
ncbi:MAG TPA: hypothetical protein VFW83_01750, partial [Bryobacteraceae bacterium]|nr:hypothetical protein [Bryobacteraceae bacterium]